MCLIGRAQSLISELSDCASACIAQKHESGVKMSQRIPAIALTALAGREDWVRALRAGFNRHIAKAVEPGELVMLIASLVRDGSNSMGE